MNIASIGQSLVLPGGELSTQSVAPSTGGGFQQVIRQLVEGAGAQQTQADQAVRDLAAGQTDDLHRVLLQVSQADLAFRLVLELRNRVTEAMQEIMRMQV